MDDNHWKKKIIPMIRKPYVEANRTENVFMNEVTLVVGPQAYNKSGAELAAAIRSGSKRPARWRDAFNDVNSAWVDEMVEQLREIDGLRIKDINYEKGKIIVEEEKVGALKEALQLPQVTQCHSAPGQQGWYL